MAGKDKPQQPPPAASGRAGPRAAVMAPPSQDAVNALKAPAPEDVLKMMGLDAKGKKIQAGAPPAPDSLEVKALEILRTPADPEAVRALHKPDEDFMRIAKSLLAPRTNSADTLDPGEEFVELTPEQILKQPALTARDILMTPPASEALAALRVGVLSNRDGSDKLYIAGKALDTFLMKGGIPGLKNFQIMSLGEAQRDITSRYLGQIAEIKPGQLHPLLAERMKKDPEVALYANYAISAGQRAGINGILYANQLWQESRFNPDAVSGKGARGISQMMPFQQGKYGLQSTDDFFDPYKSIEAGADMMLELTSKYKDQRLALVAYNGGAGAIEFVEKKLGKNQITYQDWHDFMEKRRLIAPTANSSAWQNETFEYLQKTGAGRPEDSAKPAPALR